MKKQEKTKRSRQRSPNNGTTTGFRISDELWAVLEPLLPIHINPHRFGGGRPRVPDRDCADAIFYILRTGRQWQALDQTELCPHSTAHDRFQEWAQAGVFLRLWQADLEQFEELRGIDWDSLCMDEAMTKVPLGGEKTGTNSIDCGKGEVKRSVLTEGHAVLKDMCLDKDYDSEEVRDILDEFGFTAYIRKCGEQVKAIKKW